MPAYPWGGFSNGRIPASALADYRGVLVRADAARAAYALQAAYQAATGLPLKVLEGYRDYTRQQYLRNLMKTGNGNTAAVPGTSVHGWALAFDFAAPLNNANSSQHKWMRENAGRYGFDWARGKADGEPWHWEYGNVKPTVAGLGSTPIQNEDDMGYLAWSNADKDALFMDLFGGGRRMANWKGDMVAVADIIRATEQIAETAKNAAITAQDAVTPGQENVKYDGVLYQKVKWTQEGVEALRAEAGVEVDEDELAKRLAPLLVNTMSSFSDADLKRIAKASADELLARLKN